MKRIAALILAASLTLWLTACGGGGAITPQAAIETYLTSLRDGDLESMKSVMPAAQVAEANQAGAPTAEDSAQAKEMMKNLAWVIGEETTGEDGNTADVKVMIKFGPMEAQNVFHCVKEGSGWKVDITKGAMGMGMPQ